MKQLGAQLNKQLWLRIAVTALRAIRPYLKMSAEQSHAYQTVTDMIEGLAGVPR
jgi:hypothetical protein